MPLLEFLRRGHRELPWRGRTPIATFLQTWDGLADLPDEESEETIRWAPGALDGVFSHHGDGDDDAPKAAIVARAVLRAAARGDDDSRARLYGLLDAGSVGSIADHLVERLGGADSVALAALGRWLAERAADREPAKLGLVLIGAARSRTDLPLLRLFARHDEFTKYAAFAAGRIVDDAVAEWRSMADHAKGWGKIDLVERIAERGKDRADVRHWLLRHGCENYVMDEYLAFTCATAGRLHEALEAEAIDEELLRGASTIVCALLAEGGPAVSIADYAHGQADVLALLRHLAQRPSFAAQTTARRILDWVEGAEGRSGEFRDEARRRCRAILAGVSEDEVRRRLLGDDFAGRWEAWHLAPAVDLDVWEEAFTLLGREPRKPYLYQWLMATKDPIRLRRVIALAEEHLPLGEIASGPADELGMGAKYEAHSCLDALVQRMREGDIFSARLVVTALRSPVVRNRHFAVAAIEARRARGLPAMVLYAVRVAAASEPNAEMRERLTSLL